MAARNEPTGKGLTNILLSVIGGLVLFFGTRLYNGIDKSNDKVDELKTKIDQLTVSDQSKDEKIATLEKKVDEQADAIQHLTIFEASIYAKKEDFITLEGLKHKKNAKSY